jgi:hypothetical protein
MVFKTDPAASQIKISRFNFHVFQDNLTAKAPLNIADLYDALRTGGNPPQNIISHTPLYGWDRQHQSPQHQQGYHSYN